ncbi:MULTISPECIES: carbohydrate kinase family protein [unclassified Arthrobacter]|uniref:carbohydrate kinase family protein n=1 Tax=unclassified Arthrobacter TaxID=235627 RepID=UPI0014913C45|nr:carbohydrate kinase [Arthrobacter sp. AET 35A]MBE0008423.1 carbohydrate kinase [Arthrobacter sp. AET 35A]NOJ59346.1 carbohydrate kinase [Arthrobacter sp. 260]NOJ62163.1 carbohydrate kinase [Arthrobacter sp. 147(2020)]
MLTVIGETLIDEVISDVASPRAHVGGSPMNVAVGLARLGHPCRFIGRWGDDEYGRMIQEHLRGNSVLTPMGPDKHPTSIATARLDPAGGASYKFQLVWELQGIREETDRILEGTTLLHTGSIATMLEPGATDVLAVVEQAHPLATISYDPNCRPSIVTDVAYARDQAEKFVALADVVKASDEDLEWLYPGQDVLETARLWLAKGPAMVVVTRGSLGPWAVVAGGETSVPAPAAQVVDTVGAGDSFMSALLGSLVDRGFAGAQQRNDLRHISVEQMEAVLVYAARAAAVTVSRAGANPPDRNELMTDPKLNQE